MVMFQRGNPLAVLVSLGTWLSTECQHVTAYPTRPTMALDDPEERARRCLEQAGTMASAGAVRLRASAMGWNQYRAEQAKGRVPWMNEFGGLHGVGSVPKHIQGPPIHQSHFS